MRARLLPAVAFVAAALALTGVAGVAHTAVAGTGPVRVALGSRSIDLYQYASVRVTGLTARSVEVRLVGAIDRRGLAYEWTPYRWRALRMSHGAWRGRLPAPPLLGIYRLQLRVGGGRILSSARWLLGVFPPGTMARRSSSTAAGAVRGFVAHLRGDNVLVASRRWPLARFDHRDPRLNRVFVVAYAPRGDDRPGSRSGMFVTTVRDGYHGRWRVLEAASQPYD
jgi:hypothetical protein